MCYYNIRNKENKEAAKQEGIETKEEESKRPVPGDANYIKFATTLQEIETKYGHEKQPYVYGNMLKVGSFVVFIHYVEAKDGNVYKKLRTAKVIGVNRNKKLVRVETPMKAIMELTFEELLYIREDIPESNNEYSSCRCISKKFPIFNFSPFNYDILLSLIIILKKRGNVNPSICFIYCQYQFHNFLKRN